MNKEKYNLDRERFQQLLMGAIDYELSTDEDREFKLLLHQYPEFLQEYQEFEKMKEVFQTMKFKTLPDKEWDSYWLKVYNQIERGIAWILFSVGSVILITYGLYKWVETLFASQNVDLIVKIGIFALIAGLVILFISIAREKLISRKVDPYKEVQR